MATTDLSPKGIRTVADAAKTKADANELALAGLGGGGGGASIATLSIASDGLALDVGADMGAKTLTVSVGDDDAVITFDDIGVAITRAGALAVTAGIGGGLITNAEALAQIIWYAISLMIDGGDFASKPVVTYQSFAANAFSPGNPVAAYTKVSVVAGAAVSFTVGAGVTAGFTVDP